MSLTPLTGAQEIREARDALLAALCHGQRTLRKKIGWQGGNGEYDLTWIAHAGFWVSVDPFPKEKRWILLFGSDDPARLPMVGIVCEINPPKSGVNRQCAGLFVRDETGKIYFAHSGKIGGGRKGIGKSSFLASYRGSLETVTWPDRKTTEIIVIGCINSPHLSLQVSNFVQEVERFKTLAKQGVIPTRPAPANAPTSGPRFNPEFTGRRNGYRAPSDVEARCDHGVVVNALADRLEVAGFKPHNDQSRDLFLTNLSGVMNVLFEAKTSISTGAIYQAIGQLLYHSASTRPSPRLVMVLPESPDHTTLAVLHGLRIEVLAYHLSNRAIQFRDLDAFIATLTR